MTVNEMVRESNLSEISQFLSDNEKYLITETLKVELKSSTKKEMNGHKFSFDDKSRSNSVSLTNSLNNSNNKSVIDDNSNGKMINTN